MRNLIGSGTQPLYFSRAISIGNTLATRIGDELSRTGDARLRPYRANGLNLIEVIRRDYDDERRAILDLWHSPSRPPRELYLHLLPMNKEMDHE